MTGTDLTTAKEVVKESLLGSEIAEDIQLSAQSKATFEKNSRKDDSGTEDYMSEEDFINAIAPKDEDYVSKIILPIPASFLGVIANAIDFLVAQNQTRTICDSIPCS